VICRLKGGRYPSAGYRSKAMAANVQIFMSDEGRNSEKIKDLKHFIGVLKKWSTSIVELSRC
jgi:hypothetical protein